MIDLINSNDLKTVRKNLDIGVIRRGSCHTNHASYYKFFKKEKC